MLLFPSEGACPCLCLIDSSSGGGTGDKVTWWGKKKCVFSVIKARTTPASSKWTEVTFAGKFSCLLICCSWAANWLTSFQTTVWCSQCVTAVWLSSARPVMEQWCLCIMQNVIGCMETFLGENKFCKSVKKKDLLGAMPKSCCFACHMSNNLKKKKSQFMIFITSPKSEGQLNKRSVAWRS